ncbi:dynactin subunit 1-like [Paramacrobiotus metropolitanus]|uniref:dynactin subunit 1-like n=1 Tax=Paramacrobiotus metropolitanus TaxID=2943436 RepID=UPI00244621BA|nr:dynactin subunit 1-like [Paramacrobiotus metropolitanus]
MAASPRTPPTSQWQVGDLVRVEGKDCEGKIAFIGETKFASGIWMGVMLREPKGKNNGTVKDVKYFECEENCGTFVRESQVFALTSERRGSSATSLTGSTTSLQSLTEKSGGSTPSEAHTTKTDKTAARPSVKGSAAKGALPAPSQSASRVPAPGLKAPRPSASIPSGLSSVSATESSSKKLPTFAPVLASAVAAVDSSPPLEQPSSPAKNDLPKEAPLSSREISQPVTATERKGSLKTETSIDASTVSETEAARPEPKEIAVDIHRLKRDYESENNKLRLQIEHLEINKQKMAEAHGELQKQLLAAQKEIREVKEAASTQEDLTELHENIEMLTLDREMAEEKREQMERELEDLKMKYEDKCLDLEMLQHQVSEGGHGEASTNMKVVQLEKQKQDLTEALYKLRDLLDGKKYDVQRLEKDLKAAEERNDALTVSVERHQREIATNEELLVNLREQVDAALGAEEMVERLANQKLDLEDKIEELRDTVKDYEEIMAMNNELIELSRSDERHTHEQLDMARSESSILKLRLVELQQNLNDTSQTVHKFRDLTKQLQEENNRMREQLQLSANTPTQAAVVPASVDFRLKIQDDKVNAERVDRKILMIKEKMLQQEQAYLMLFMPDIFAISREDSFIRICVLPELIGLKLRLIEEEVQMKFEVPTAVDLSAVQSFDAHRRDEVAYASYFNFLLKILEANDRDIDYAIRTAPAEVFGMLNDLEGRVERPEKAIQYYIDQLRQSRLDDTISLEYLETSTKDMDDILERLNAVEASARSSMDKMKDVMDIIAFGMKSIAASALGLKLLAGDTAPEFSKLFMEFANKSEIVTDIVRKVKRPLDTDNELRAVMLSETVDAQLKDIVNNLHRCVALCYLWYQTVNTQSAVHASDKPPLDNEHLKRILYAENDKGSFRAQTGFYKTTTTSPQQTMLNFMEETTGTLQQFFKEINDGEWHRGGVKLPEMPKHPLKVRAETLKKALADAEALKSRLATKDEEIIELKKNLRSKVEEISEYRLRRDMTERKLETASKTEEEKLSKLQVQILDLTSKLHKVQNEYDTETAHLRIQLEQSEADKKQMDEKLKQTSKRFLEISPRKTPGGVSTSGYPSDGQIDVLRQINSSLRAEIINLKGQQIKRDLDQLLPPLKLPSRAVRDPFTERLNKLKRQQMELETEKRMLLAKTVVDLSKPKEERDRLRKFRRTMDAELQLKLRKIQTEISELSGPGRFFEDLTLTD